MSRMLQISYLTSIGDLSKMVGVKLDTLLSTIKSYDMYIYNDHVLYSDVELIMKDHDINYELDPVCLFDKRIDSLNNFEIKNNKFSIGIVGHVDHGKTTIISNMINKKIDETMNITQSVNIYNVRDLYIMDTPGHKCFHHYRDLILKHIDCLFIVVSLYDGIERETERIMEMLSERECDLKIFVIFTKKDIARYDCNDIMPKILNYGINILGHIESSIDKNIYDDLMILLKKHVSVNNRKNSSINVVGSSKSVSMLARVSSSRLTNRSFILFDNKVLRVKKITDIMINKSISSCDPISYVYVHGDTIPCTGDFYVTNCVKEARLYEKIITYKRYMKGNIVNKAFGNSFIFVCNDFMTIDTVKLMLKERDMLDMASVVQYTDINSLLIMAKNSSVIAYNIDSHDIHNIADKVVIIDYIYELEDFMNANNRDIFANTSISGIAKIIKVFDIKGKLIAGCKVIKGSFNMNDVVSFVSENDHFDPKNIHKYNVISLKKEDDFVKKVTTGDIFGLIVDSNIKYEVDMHVVSCVIKKNKRRGRRY